MTGGSDRHATAGDESRLPGRTVAADVPRDHRDRGDEGPAPPRRRLRGTRISVMTLP